MKKLGVLIIAVAVAVMAGPAICGTITVYADAAGKYPTIQDAIDVAVNGDIIIATPGRYTGEGNRDIDFLGKAITLRSTDPNNPNVVATTVIDCQNSGRGFNFHNGEDANSVLAGLTITDGNTVVGGGIYCDEGSSAVLCQGTRDKTQANRRLTTNDQQPTTNLQQAKSRGRKVFKVGTAQPTKPGRRNGPAPNRDGGLSFDYTQNRFWTGQAGSALTRREYYS